MLPTFGDAEGQFPYSPQMLEAMTHVGLAIYSQEGKEKLAHLDAIKLKPDMPQAYYYKGRPCGPTRAVAGRRLQPTNRCVPWRASTRSSS